MHFWIPVEAIAADLVAAIASTGISRGLLRLSDETMQGAQKSFQHHLLWSKWLSVLLEDKRIDPSCDGAAICDAVRHGHLELVRMLLEDSRVAPSSPAFLHACRTGYPAIVSLFLDHPQFDAAGGDGSASSCPFTQSAEANEHNKDVIDILVADGRFDPTLSSNQALRRLCTRGNAEGVRALLCDPRVDPRLRGDEAMRVACISNGADVIRVLIEKGADPAVCNGLTLRMAVERGYVDVVRVLLAQEGVDASRKLKELLQIVSTSGNTKMLSLLLEAPHCDPKPYVSECLVDAGRRGFGDIVCLLLADPRVDPADASGVPLSMLRDNTRSRKIRFRATTTAAQLAVEIKARLMFEKGELEADLAAMTVREIRRIAQTARISGRSKMGRYSLLRALCMRFGHPRTH